MSKVLLGVLLAGIAAPALAAGGPHDRHHNDDNSNSSQQESRAERPAREQRRAGTSAVIAPRGRAPTSRASRPGRTSAVQWRASAVQERSQYNTARPECAAVRNPTGSVRSRHVDVQRSRPVIRDNPYSSGTRHRSQLASAGADAARRLLSSSARFGRRQWAMCVTTSGARDGARSRCNADRSGTTVIATRGCTGTQLAQRSSLRLARPPPSSLVAVPHRPVHRSVRLGLSELFDRLRSASELLSAELLDRSGHVWPALSAAGHAVGAVLQRRLC